MISGRSGPGQGFHWKCKEFSSETPRQAHTAPIGPRRLQTAPDGPTPPEPQNGHWETLFGNEFVYGASRCFLRILGRSGLGNVFCENAKNLTQEAPDKATWPQIGPRRSQAQPDGDRGFQTVPDRSK